MITLQHICAKFHNKSYAKLSLLHFKICKLTIWYQIYKTKKCGERGSNTLPSLPSNLQTDALSTKLFPVFDNYV